MARLRWGWLAVLLLAAACTAAPPTVTSVPLHRPPGGGVVVSVCYDSGNAGRREIEQVALEACPKPAVAVTPWRTDTVLNECPLLKKSRISFICVPAPGTSLLPK